MDKFPPDFLWGTATSAHQVEGDNTNNDWYLFEQTEGNILNNTKSDKAVRHYEFFEQDFDYAKQLNNNAYRFSIEWSRIEPQKGVFNKEETEHYKKVLIALKKHDITPMVTLHHFTNPIWIKEQGGWENEKTAEDFVSFVNYIVNELKDYVNLWVTINEPQVYIYQGYILGGFPPAYKWEMEKGVMVFVNMIKAHAGAFKVIHNMDKNAKVSIATHFSLFEPSSKWNPIEWILTFYYNYFINHSFLQSLLTGKIRLLLPDKKFPFLSFKKFNLNDVKNTLDFIGLNYYTRFLVKSNDPTNFAVRQDALKNDLGWEIYPEGIYRALMNLKKYNLPVYITENGIADKEDSLRPKFIIDHLKYVFNTIKKGVNLKGYFYWSLMDNFEWNKGDQHFGLLKVNFSSPNKERYFTKGAEIYSEIAKNNGFTDDISSLL